MFKQIITALLCTLLFLPAFAENNKKIKTDIDNVTVFLSGAQVFRSAKVSVGQGITELVFHGLSTTIDPASVQAGGKGNFIILDVKHNIEYPEPIRTVEVEMPEKLKKELQSLEDSLIDIDFELQDLRDRQDALKREKKMLTENKLMTGGGRSDSLEILIGAMDFFRKKLADINTQSLAIRKQERAAQKEKSRMSARANELRNWKAFTKAEQPKIPGPDHQVIVTVHADYATTGTVKLNYLVTGAGWTPSYDLRAENVNKPVEITYKANVWQNSGKDWEDVKLKLSTANPRKSNVKPVLPRWYVSYYVAQQIIKNSMTNLNMQLSSPTVATTDEEMERFGDTTTDGNSILKDALRSSSFSSRLNTIANYEFSIRLDYTIPSDGKPHLVAVHEDKVPAEYYHFAVPKVEKEAFLVARVTDWEDLNLLPGPANLYYGGTYIGKTTIDPGTLSDTLELSMGRDQGLTVSRKKLKDEEKVKVIGDKKKKTITIELVARNNKAGTVELTLEDQVPMTADKSIEIELEDGDGADYDEDTGSLVWKLKIPARESRKVKFRYTIKSDKDKQLI